jgi:hypothetical protein
VCQWCEFKSRQGKNKKLTAQNSNSNTVWIIFVTDRLKFVVALLLWCLTPLSQYFSYIVAVSFIGGGNRSIRRKPPTHRKSLTKLYNIMYTSPRAGFELTSVVIGADCIDSCKSNYHIYDHGHDDPFKVFKILKVIKINLNM